MSRCLGKSGVVTGASGGLGRATALALAADGANVLAVSRNLDGLQETVELAQRSDGSVLAVRRRRWCLDSSGAMWRWGRQICCDGLQLVAFDWACLP